VTKTSSRSRSSRRGAISVLLLFYLFTPLYSGEAPKPTHTQQDKLPDLIVHQVALSSAGSVIYQIANGGQSGTGSFFVVDVYLDGVRKDSIRHQALPAMSVQAAQSNLARLSDCQRGAVRLMVDAQNTIRESNEKNNEYNGQLTTPCSKAPK
jgi:subtilase family serine protease